MTKYTITITVDNPLSPGNLDHLLAIAGNPNNKAAVKMTVEEV